MAGRSSSQRRTLQRRLLRTDAAWIIMVLLLVLMVRSSVTIAIYWGLQLPQGAKLLMDAARIVGVVGVLVGGILRGPLCSGLHRQRAAGGGWKLLLGPSGPESAAVRLQAAAPQHMGSGPPQQDTAAADAKKQGCSGRRGLGSGSRSVTFTKRVGVKSVPDLREVSEQWKAKLWWQPTDFEEFLRVRVLIGRAYVAVAKRRGVRIGSDFPAEPVLSHESRLGLNLGRQSRRESNRRRHAKQVLEEQLRQLEGPEGQRKSISSLDMDSLAKVARRASKADRSRAVEEGRWHHEKVVSEMDQQDKGAKVGGRPRQRAVQSARAATPDDDLVLDSIGLEETRLPPESPSGEAPSAVAAPKLYKALQQSPRRALALAATYAANASAKAMEQTKRSSAASGADKENEGGAGEARAGGAGEACEGDAGAEPRLPETPRKVARPREVATPAEDGKLKRAASPSVRDLSQRIERQISARELSDRERRLRQSGERLQRTERDLARRAEDGPPRTVEQPPAEGRCSLSGAMSSGKIGDPTPVRGAPSSPHPLAAHRRRCSLDAGQPGKHGPPRTSKRRSSEPVVPRLDLSAVSFASEESSGDECRSSSFSGHEKYLPGDWILAAPRDWSLAAAPEVDQKVASPELECRSTMDGSESKTSGRFFGSETRGFGLLRGELERAGLSPAGHLLLPAQSDSSASGEDGGTSTDDGTPPCDGAESLEECADAVLSEDSTEEDEDED